MGDISSNRTYNGKLGGTIWTYINPTSNPDGERVLKLQNAGVATRQLISRKNLGVGSETSSSDTTNYGAFNTAGDLALTETMQFQSAAGNYVMIRASSRYVVYPG